MSRIGNQPVPLPSGVEVSVDPSTLRVKGPKGQLEFPLFPEIRVEVVDGNAVVSRSDAGSAKNAAALHGLVRAHLANMVQGVTQGYERILEIQGTGWNAKPAGKGVELQVGFCHTVHCVPPEGITVELRSPTVIVVSGIDKQKVSQFAANIRRIRPPEPYKGKGIRYQGEEVRRKAGKALA